MSQALEDNIDKAIFTLVVTFFFSVAIYLYSETKDIGRAKRGFYQLATFIFSALFFYFFEENLFTNPQTEVMVYLILTSLGVVAFVFIASFINKLRAKDLSQREFYIASYALVIKILMSMTVGLVAMFLGFIALSSTFTLFDVTNIDEGNWFAYWSAFSLTLFAPVFFLVNLPSAKVGESKDMSEIQSNKFYAFLINYVGIGAIVIYFLILYAYTIKVLINFSDWPQGEVTWLVILFSFFGYLVYFASFAFVDTFKPAQILRKILPIAIFLQTFMLFYAIGLRINQYDLTINRCLVMVFGLWLFGLSLYFIISKKKRLVTIFYSLLIVIIFISIGPWSVYLVPEWRQQGNLEMNLKKANILQASGEIVTLENYRDISVELSGEIYDGIDYLCNYHGCKTLDKYFDKEIIEIKKKDKEEFKENKQKRLEQEMSRDNIDNEYIKSIESQEYRKISNWEIVRQLTENIKVRKYYKDKQVDNVPRDFSFRNNNSYFNESIDVRTYDYYVQVFSDNLDARMSLNGIDNIKKDDLSNTYRAIIDTASERLELYFEGELMEIFQIEETVIKSLLEKKDDSLESKNAYEQGILLASEDMTFNLSGLKYDLKLVLGDINIRNPEWVTTEEKGENGNDDEYINDIMMEMRILEVPYVGGYILIKKK